MVNFNGQLVEYSEAKLVLTNRGYAYGDSLFETIRIINGKVIFWEDHYFRLMSSMRILRMDIPMSFSPEFLEEEILNCVNANNLNNSRIKLQVHRKEGGFYKPAHRDIEYIITCTSLEQQFYTITEEDYVVELFKDHYVNTGLLSTIKSNNRIINVLGSIYAEENGYQNCLLVNDQKQIVEALNGNIFIVKGHHIKTAPLSDGCLNGVTRKQILNILNKLDSYTVEEASISPFELQKVDEIFITNVITGIQPITQYRKKTYGNTVAKDVLGKLNAHARLNN